MKVLTADEARQLWPVLEPAITLALSRQGPPSPLYQGELFRAIFTGQAHVLVGERMIVRNGSVYPDGAPVKPEHGGGSATTIEGGIGVCYIDGDVCNLAAYNGTIREIKLLTNEMIRRAREAGCHSIRWIGDPAWMRVIPGARIRCVVMELPIA